MCALHQSPKHWTRVTNLTIKLWINKSRMCFTTDSLVSMVTACVCVCVCVRVCVCRWGVKWEHGVNAHSQRQRVDLCIELTHRVSHSVKHRRALMFGGRRHVAPWRPIWAAAGRRVNYSVVIKNVSALICGEDLTCTCTCRVRGQRSRSWRAAPPQICWLILMINNLLSSFPHSEKRSRKLQTIWVQVSLKHRQKWHMIVSKPLSFKHKLLL